MVLLGGGLQESPGGANQKDRFGVEPICAVLTEFGHQMAPSTYYAALTRPRSERACAGFLRGASEPVGEGGEDA